jgi:signal transduction histidine kinase
VKYSRPGGLVQFSIGAEKEQAVFRVKDQGVGIPAADQDRLFQAFHRGKNVNHVSGTGLGLVIVKRCVDMHGGRISFQSKENGGTTFTVTIPLFTT